MLLEDAGFIVDELDFGGNSLVSTGSLMGMIQADFSTRELDEKDAVYPWNILARVHRPAEGE